MEPMRRLVRELTRFQVRLPLAAGGPVEGPAGAAVDGLASDALEAR